MGSRDKDTKSLQDKLKNYFKKGSSAPLPPRNELSVSAELERALSRDQPLQRRLKLLRDTGDRLLTTRLQQGGVERLWAATRDLLDEPCTEARHAQLQFLCCVVEGQGEQLVLMRSVLFRYLRDTLQAHAPDDAPHRFRLLQTLTNCGKDITCLEEQMGPFLLEWMPLLQSPGFIVEFLQLVTNVIKFNATYLDEEVVHGIVNWSCYVCVWRGEPAAVHASLALLEAVVCYSLLPRRALPAFVHALARTVNIEHYCQNSWKVMRYVVGADLGYAAIQEMVDILNSAGDGGTGVVEGGAGGEADAGLLRGAVFYINMALWGARRVHTLKISYLAVLPAFLQALQSNHQVVTYEVLLAIQSLAGRASGELHEPAWDMVLEILHTIIIQNRALEPASPLIHSHVHALLTSLEQVSDAGLYCGDPDGLLRLIDLVGHERPEASTIRLISQQLCALSPARGDWLAQAVQVADKYIKHEPRPTVRAHTVAVLHALIKRYRHVHEEEALERVAVPVLSACGADGAGAVRSAAARAATELAAHTHCDLAADLIDVLEKILHRPLELYGSESGASVAAEADPADVRLALGGLLEVFHGKLLRAPAQHAARAFLVLLGLLEHCYRGNTQPYHDDVQLKILELIFGLRVSASGAIGYCYEGGSGGGGGSGVAGGVRIKPVFSPYLFVEPCHKHQQTQAPLPGTCCVPWTRVLRCLTALLVRSSSWQLVSSTLRGIPALLGGCAAVRARRRSHHAPAIDLLAHTLSAMVTDKSLNLPDSLRLPATQKLSQSEFHGAVLPALATLAPYHQHLEPATQHRIVRALLKYGVVLRQPSSQQCINALTIFTLEARDTMVKMLPEVLLDLSKISDTKTIACPMLEFLSTLTRLPKVFASFVEDQYMSVFAILLPYTNPSRYNHYVVSLAHHVTAAWFLKCRLAYRRNFVPFIIHGLHNYIIMPFEEQLFKSNNPQPPPSAAAAAAAALNEDSSNRKRSSSLGSKGVSRAPLSSRGGAASTLSATAAFHWELTETCVDLLARYAFSVCSVKPHRSSTVEFLLNGGQSTTWLVGHKLVTITTSGCQQNGLKQGLCDRCTSLCRQHVELVNSPLPPLEPHRTPLAPDEEDPALCNSNHVQVQVNDGTNSLALHVNQNSQEVRRYSKHSLQHSRSTETSSSSLSDASLLQPESGLSTRQNSAENNKMGDPVADALAAFTQRFEKISKEVDTDDTSWSRVGALVSAGACPCWCSNWAEVHVRAPTGDVSWVLRMQNQGSWEFPPESPVHDVLGLLAPSLAPHPAAPPPPPHGSSESGLGDSRHVTTSDSDTSRSRSSSSASQSRHSHCTQELHKSSSDTVVTSERRPPHAATHCIGAPQPLRSHTHTSPINIPGSPQRQPAAVVDGAAIPSESPVGKSRHPVRRSNSSPEMSSSWKMPAARGDVTSFDDISPETDMILLPSCEPTSTSMSLHASKKAAKKSDMRVSCEAIPEEMSGTSPLAPAPHPLVGDRAAGAGGATSEPALLPLPDDRRHTQLQKVASDGSVQGRPPRGGAPPAPRDKEELPPLARSKRSNTISVMSPTRRRRDNQSPRGQRSGGGGGGGGGGITPAFVLLQLYHNMPTAAHSPHAPPLPAHLLNPLTERPLRVHGVQHERTIKNLDLVPPVETYKIGVLYVGLGQQDNEVLILKNEYGSVRYAEFLSGLGSLVELAGEPAPHLFLNLERGGKDGHYTYVWHDDIMQVHFHVATAMPTCHRDPTCNEKRKYIGNDHVSIVYNDSGQDFNIHTIKGQFNSCIVVVEPLEHGINRVLLKTKDERIRTKFLSHLEPAFISDQNVALLARQMALHAALASHISASLNLTAGLPYASNSLERLRIIKRLRARLQAERDTEAHEHAPYAPRADVAKRVMMDDFTKYT